MDDRSWQKEKQDYDKQRNFKQMILCPDCFDSSNMAMLKIKNPCPNEMQGFDHFIILLPNNHKQPAPLLLPLQEVHPHQYQILGDG